MADVGALTRGLGDGLVEDIDRALGRKAQIRMMHLGNGVRAS